MQCNEVRKTKSGLTYFKSPPTVLPEPLYYLSDQQCKIVENWSEYNSIFEGLAAVLPCWIPHRHVACVLKYGSDGIRNAISKLKGKYYLWATEFENVHSYFIFDEPTVHLKTAHNGIVQIYKNSEDFYQCQKHQIFKNGTFNSYEWDCIWRDKVMTKAIEMKFNGEQKQSKSLKKLLVSTYPHELLSIKEDTYWGVDGLGRGENKLAVLLMQLRDKLIRRQLQNISQENIKSETPLRISNDLELSKDWCNKASTLQEATLHKTTNIDKFATGSEDSKDSNYHKNQSNPDTLAISRVINQFESDCKECACREIFSNVTDSNGGNNNTANNNTDYV